MNKEKPTANELFLATFRYLFILFSLSITSVFIFSFSAEGFETVTFYGVMTSIGVILTCTFVLAFVCAYLNVKQGVQNGEVSEGEILSRNNRLSVNIFKK